MNSRLCSQVQMPIVDLWGSSNYLLDWYLCVWIRNSCDFVLQSHTCLSAKDDEMTLCGFFLCGTRWNARGKHEHWEFNKRAEQLRDIWIYMKLEFIMTFCYLDFATNFMLCSAFGKRERVAGEMNARRMCHVYLKGKYISHFKKDFFTLQKTRSWKTSPTFKG